jgi:hypothetical protein
MDNRAVAGVGRTATNFLRNLAHGVTICPIRFTPA